MNEGSPPQAAEAQLGPNTTPAPNSQTPGHPSFRRYGSSGVHPLSPALIRDPVSEQVGHARCVPHSHNSDEPSTSAALNAGKLRDWNAKLTVMTTRRPAMHERYAMPPWLKSQRSISLQQQKLSCAKFIGPLRCSFSGSTVHELRSVHHRMQDPRTEAEEEWLCKGKR